MILLILFILIGFLLSTWIFRDASFIERVAYTLLFGLIAVPLVAINISLFGKIYIGEGLLYGICAVFLILLGKHGYSYFKSLTKPKIDRKDLVVLAAALIVAVFSWLYFTNKEVLWAVNSYLLTGKSQCFTMQTFKLVETLNPGSLPKPIPEFYDIISTPGNALFTGGFMPIFGLQTFQVLYVLFSINLLLFMYLLLRNWTGRHWLPLVVALFAVFNPYSLSIEILDRNAMAFSLSAAFFYSLLKYKDKTLLHGALFGVTAGVGLRFLPITFIAPIFLFYIANNTAVKKYIWFILAAVPVFIFNLPHLSFNGFHAIGYENTPFVKMFFTALIEFIRTPFVPFPNAVYYLVNFLSYFGFAAAALALYGAVRALAKRRLLFFVFLMVFTAPYLVLAAQVDWIEADKNRIFLTTFLAVFMFIGYGAHVLVKKESFKKELGIFAIILIVTIVAGLGLGRINGKPDNSMFDRKLIYQREAASLREFNQSSLAPAGLLPDYQRLYQKIDIPRKKAEEKLILNTLFSEPGQNEWVKRWIVGKVTEAAVNDTPANEYVNLKIDFDKLITDMPNSASIAAPGAELFTDFEKKKDLFDIYFKGMDVSWQKEKLPVVILTGKPEFEGLKELNIDLNAFASYGSDDFGFERVNLINFWFEEDQRKYAFQSGMTALPTADSLPVITLRIPKDLEIIIRNWIVNGANGTPFRIDSWSIHICSDGQPKVNYHYMEPETYL